MGRRTWPFRTGAERLTASVCSEYFKGIIDKQRAAEAEKLGRKL